MGKIKSWSRIIGKDVNQALIVPHARPVMVVRWWSKLFKWAQECTHKLVHRATIATVCLSDFIRIGSGDIMSEEDKCPECKAEKIIEEQKELEVKLDPGVSDNHVYTFEGEGNEVVRFFL